MKDTPKLAIWLAALAVATAAAGTLESRAEEPETYSAVVDEIASSAAVPSQAAPGAVMGAPEAIPAMPVPTATPAPSPKASPKPKAPPKPKTAPAAKPKAAAKPPSKLPPLLQEVEAKYTQAATLQAEFSQVNTVAALNTKKKSSGVIMVKRPDKLRWETLRPDMNLLVSDGRKFWFYTPPFDEGERGQVIERRSNEVNSRLANALLSGRFSVAREMKIAQEGPSRFVLKPKPGSAGTVSRAEIEVNPELKLIQKVTLEHKGGNRSEISLDKIELGKSIGDEAFFFTPPANTDVVTQ